MGDIRLKQAMSGILSEDLIIYSALIEQLQRRVNELEMRMATPMMAGTHS